MKKTFLALLFIVSSMSVFALSKDSANAVTMASYEQRWLDDEGTIYLKNNTSDTISNVAFTLTYYDMKGNELDYKDFRYKITIVPGKTKSLDIPAFNHERNYHYYKTQESLGSPLFKISYELKGFNFPEKSKSKEVSSKVEVPKSNNVGEGSSFWIMMIIFIIFIMGCAIGLYILVAVMAKRRNRNIALWVLLSFVASPLIVALILLCIGSAEKKTYY